MHRFKVVLVALADRLFGCSHSRTSFPITLRTSTRKAETYVVCLECGRRFAYDWARMCIATQPAAWAGGGRPQTGNEGSAVFPAANRYFQKLLPFPIRVTADAGTRIAKSVSRLLAVFALALGLSWVSGAEAPSSALGTAVARPGEASQDRGQPKADKKQKRGRNQANPQATSPVFGPRDRDIINGYYRNRTSNLPPGLAKRGGDLPPGLERQLQRNGTLPPGLQKRLEPFPADLRRQLPPLPANYAYGVIDGSAIIVNQRTKAIVDVMYDILNR